MLKLCKSIRQKKNPFEKEPIFYSGYFKDGKPISTSLDRTLFDFNVKEN